MPEIYISLEEAAVFESVAYDAMKKRVQRNPSEFKAQAQPRESGGKDQILVAVSSLSPKARKLKAAAISISSR